MKPMIAFLLAGVTAAAMPADDPLQSTGADRGEVKAGPVLAHTFTLTHRGTGKLTVTAVEGGCGCVRAAVARTELRPGESTELAVEINTLTQAEGPNAWRVVVRYQVETPARPEAHTAEFRVTAKLVREVTITPPAVAISTAGEAAQTLVVADRRDRPLTVTKATSSSPHLTATVRAAGVQNGRHLQAIELKLSADAPVGHSDETVTLSTDDPIYREFKVPVRIAKRTAGSVAVSPDRIALRFAAGQAEASGLLHVRSVSGGPVRVAKADCDDPALRLKWSAGAGPTATVRVTASAGRTSKADVRVFLAEPAGHLVVVPVSWSDD